MLHQDVGFSSEIELFLAKGKGRLISKGFLVFSILPKNKRKISATVSSLGQK